MARQASIGAGLLAGVAGAVALTCLLLPENALRDDDLGLIAFAWTPYAGFAALAWGGRRSPAAAGVVLTGTLVLAGTLVHGILAGYVPDHAFERWSTLLLALWQWVALVGTALAALAVLWVPWLAAPAAGESERRKRTLGILCAAGVGLSVLATGAYILAQHPGPGAFPELAWRIGPYVLFGWMAYAARESVPAATLVLLGLLVSGAFALWAGRAANADAASARLFAALPVYQGAGAAATAVLALVPWARARRREK